MSANQSPENKLAQSLVWSTKTFSLTEFVQKYPLPQIVSVAKGYCGAEERTTFSRGEILILHFMHKTSKFLCQTRHGNAKLVDASCPLKAEVISMDCHESVVNAYKLSTTYKKVRYVRVLDSGLNLNESAEESLTKNDILHIKKTDGATLQCRNVATAQAVSISTGSNAEFVPLVDPYKYTLTEIRKKFKLPAKIRFKDKTEEKRLRNKPDGQLSPKESPLLCDMGQMTAIEEIQDSDVIATTVCSNPKKTQCLPISTTLEIQVRVAEGFVDLHGDDTHQQMVITLDNQLNRTNLNDFEDFGIYGYVHAIKETMDELGSEIAAYQASLEITKLQREHLKSLEQRRRQKKAHRMKALPELPKSLQKPVGTNVIFTSEDDYEVPVDYVAVVESGEKPTYEDIDTYAQRGSNYTDLKRTNSEASTNKYQALLTDPRRTQGKQSTSQPSGIQNQPLPPTPPLLPSSNPSTLPSGSPPQTQEDKHADYEAISRYPKDLTGLSVADVTKLLKYLGMKNYVDIFKNELIDGTMLTTLDEDSLQFLNIPPFHCKKLMKFIRGWRPNV